MADDPRSVPSKKQAVYVSHLRAAIAYITNRCGWAGVMAPDREVLEELVDRLSANSSASETTMSYKPKVLRLAPGPEQCEIARASTLYQAGDVIVVAIGEGDCLMYCEELPQPSPVETVRLRCPECKGILETISRGRFRCAVCSILGSSEETAKDGGSYDEECMNCGLGWSKHLTDKLICPDAAIADVYRFRQETEEQRQVMATLRKLPRQPMPTAEELRASPELAEKASAPLCGSELRAYNELVSCERPVGHPGNHSAKSPNVGGTLVWSDTQENGKGDV